MPSWDNHERPPVPMAAFRVGPDAPEFLTGHDELIRGLEENANDRLIAEARTFKGYQHYPYAAEDLVRRLVAALEALSKP